MRRHLRCPGVSPTQDAILLVSWQDYPSIARVSTPFLRLAGVRVWSRRITASTILRAVTASLPAPGASNWCTPADGSQIPIRTSRGRLPGRTPMWAADGKRFAFVNLAPDAVELWIGDSKSGKIHKVPGVRLNPMFNDEMQWMPDQKTLLVRKLLPEGMGASAARARGALPVQASRRRRAKKEKAALTKIEDTLRNKHDEDVFDYYAASPTRSWLMRPLGAITPVGKPGNYDLVAAAPDGQHILVAAIHKPYSYVTTYDRFPREVEVWDTSDRARVQVHTVASLPLADRVPIAGVPVGPRTIFPGVPPSRTTLVWAEALDVAATGKLKFRLATRSCYRRRRSKAHPPVEITRTEQRYIGFSWGEQADTAFLNQYDERAGIGGGPSSLMSMPNNRSSA